MQTNFIVSSIRPRTAAQMFLVAYSLTDAFSIDMVFHASQLRALRCAVYVLINLTFWLLYSTSTL